MDKRKTGARERTGKMIDKKQARTPSTEKISPRLGVVENDAIAAIENAKATLPRLCRYGMLEPSQECDEAFSVDGVLTSLIYLSRFPKHREPTHSSYLLKHLAEEWGCKNDLDCYVANGELVVAAAHLQFPLKWDGSSPNVVVGVRLPRGYVRRWAWDRVVD